MGYIDDMERLYAGFFHSDSSHCDILQESIDFLISILSNIIKFPYEPKYKKFKANHEKVRKLVVDIHGSYYFMRGVCKFKLEKEDEKDGSEPQQYFILHHNDIAHLKSALSILKDLKSQMTYMLYAEIIKIVQMDSSIFFAGFLKSDTVDDVKELVARTRSDRNLVKGYLLKEFDPHGILSPEKRKALVSEEMILQFTTFSKSSASQSTAQQLQLLDGEITVEDAKLGGSMLRLTWPGDFGESMMEKTAAETSKKIEEEKEKKLEEVNARIKAKEKAKAEKKKQKEDALAKYKADRERQKRW